MGKRIPPCHLAPQARILSSTIVLVPYYRGDDILVSAWRKFSRDVASSSVRRASANGMAPPSQGTWLNQRATRPHVGSSVSAENPNPSAASVNMMKPRKASSTDSASSWAGVLVFLSGMAIFSEVEQRKFFRIMERPIGIEPTPEPWQGSSSYL